MQLGANGLSDGEKPCFGDATVHYGQWNNPIRSPAGKKNARG
jgi:hypothetical protein